MFHNEEKQRYEDRLNACLNKYSRVLFVGMNNVRSQQAHQVRAALRGKAEFLMGKKTLQSKIVEKRASAAGASESDKTFYAQCEEHNLLAGNSGLIFTNEEISTITEILDTYRVKAPARVGAIAPCEVIVPAGNTGMEPTQTAFFQALNIATKIARGTVEITSEKKVLSPGDRVDNSTAILLQKLNISPFFYQVEVLQVWDRGVLFTREDLSMNDASIEQCILEGISNITAMTAGAGIPSAATVGPMILDAFKNILAFSVATAYEFEEFNGKELREAALSGKLAAAAATEAAAAPAAGGAAAAAPAEEEDEEEDDFGMGGLF